MKLIGPKSIGLHLFIAALLMMSLLPGCHQSTGASRRQPFAEKGVLDIFDWNFESDGPVALDGEWRFFWHQLLKPDDPKGFDETSENGWADLPGAWNRYRADGALSGGFGYATYSLVIHHHARHTPLALAIGEISTAYTLFVDGRRVGGNGRVVTDAAMAEPERRPEVIDFIPESNSTRLLLQVSNFNHREGGPLSRIWIGARDRIHKQETKDWAISLFLIGSLLTMGFYHLSLFLLKGKYEPPIFFGLFCCIVALRTALTSEGVFNAVWPDVTWPTLLKAEYLTFYLAVPVFALFMASLFPKEFSKKVLVIVAVVSLGFSVIVLAFPPMIFTHTVHLFQGFTVLFGVYLIHILIRGFRNKREGSHVVLIGFFILFGATLYDIMRANHLIQSDYVLQLGLYLFVFSQAYLLSLKLSSTITRVENQKKELIESHQRFENSRMALILGLTKLAEYRDEDTGSHLERIREYVKILALELAKTDKYKDYITESYVKDLYQSSILHDIGKVGIPDAILLKPGKLTQEEFEVIKTHASIGGEAIAAIESESRVRSFLTLSRDIAYCHHEKWDGSGYPEGLKGEQVPLSARIIAVADVYDALTSERPYKKAFSHETAMKIILEESGTHFDPQIVDVFKLISDQFREIKDRFQD